ncbi:MAG TPA: CPBP family intramembrane glutamic endopeptidase [Anaerolineales bacterium]|nr:CPBP family intramembrane glutamic endopeptidase [Anaerolineales bacterium]
MSQPRQNIIEPAQPLREPGGLRAFIQRYDIVLFFLLTFLFSWLIWFITPYLPDTHDWQRIQGIASAGPVIIAILLSTLLQPGRDRSRAKRHFVVFAIVFAGAAGIGWLDSLWWKYPMTGVEIMFDILLALLAAYVISGAFSPQQGVRALLHRLVKRGVGMQWILVAILLWPTIVLVSNGAARWLGISVPANPSIPNVPLIPLIVETFFWVLLFASPLHEDPGWWGFALPRLQAWKSPLVASIWLGILWGLWHLPLHVMGYYPFGAAGFMIRLQEIPSAIIFVWLFNRSKGSLLPVVLLHVARNTTSIFLGRAYIPVFILWLLLACVLVVWDKMWRPLPAADSENARANTVTAMST